LTSFYIETLAFSICAAYGVHRGMPISTYGEHVVITIQCLIQNILYWKFSNLTSGHKIKAVSFYLFLWIPMILGENFPEIVKIQLPEVFWMYVPFYIAGMNVVVKCSQIKTNYKGGSTGNLSFVTSFFNLYGTTLRIVTTLTELNDFAWLSMYLIGFSLNVVIISQFWWYWNGKKKVE
jgi:mannose-P-dolichol utilization defect protein 1